MKDLSKVTIDVYENALKKGKQLTDWYSVFGIPLAYGDAKLSVEFSDRSLQLVKAQEYVIQRTYWAAASTSDGLTSSPKATQTTLAHSCLG
jgi:hypothetical protein